jgi:hypothetical protein
MLPDEGWMGMMPQDQFTAWIASILVLLVPLLLWWFVRRVRQGKGYPLRRIRAYEALRGVLGQATESGKKVHVTVGSGGIGGDQTVAVSAGLAVLRYLADQGASMGVSPLVTVADPVALLAAQDTLYRAYQQAGRGSEYRSTDVALIAPDPTAYAVGAQDVGTGDDVSVNVMVGSFGQEYLLLGEAGAHQREVMQVAGSNQLSAQPFVVATADHALIGEEIFAGGAYLDDRPEHIASLQVQDLLRVGIVIAILVGVVVKSVVG